MSSALGEIIALGLTPLMVPTPDYIALMNIVWFIPAALGFVLCIYKVNCFLYGNPKRKTLNKSQVGMQIKHLKYSYLG